MIIRTDMGKTYEVEGVVDYTPYILEELRDDAEAMDNAMNLSLLKVSKPLDARIRDIVYNTNGYWLRKSGLELADNEILLIVRLDFIDDEGDELTRLIGVRAMDYEAGWALFYKNRLNESVGIHYSEKDLIKNIPDYDAIDFDETWTSPRGIEPLYIIRQVEACDLSDEQERLAMAGLL